MITMKKTFVRGLQGREKLCLEDSARLARWTRQYGFDGAAKRLGLSPTLIHKLSYEGSASLASIKHVSEVLRTIEPV